MPLPKDKRADPEDDTRHKCNDGAIDRAEVAESFELTFFRRGSCCGLLVYPLVYAP